MASTIVSRRRRPSVSSSSARLMRWRASPSCRSARRPLVAQLLQALGAGLDSVGLGPAGGAQAVEDLVELGLAGRHQRRQVPGHRHGEPQLLAPGRRLVPVGDMATESVVDLRQAPAAHRPPLLQAGGPDLQVPTHGGEGGRALRQSRAGGSFGDRPGGLGLGLGLQAGQEALQLGQAGSFALQPAGQLLLLGGRRRLVR